ncbi:unnamed protein product [Schistosoma turkestanicum]|nr:unnamed protein product [Schistosoma turkestanicum]
MPNYRNQSPRDEMLLHPEDNLNSPHMLEPSMPLPLFRGLVTPHMDKDMSSDTLQQIDPPGFRKGDIIIDDQPANGPFTEKHESPVRRWVSSFTSKQVIVNNGEVKELQKQVVREPDGTEVHTTIERSPDGEKKSVFYKRPDGQQFDVTNSEDLQIMNQRVPPTEEHYSENKYSRIFDAVRRWYHGN